MGVSEEATVGVPVSVLLDGKGSALETLPLDATLRDAVERLTARNIGSVLITDAEGKLAGILSERDIVRELAATGPEALEVSVTRVMSAEARTCTPGTNTDELMRIMTEERIRHVPVVDVDRCLIGIVSIGDVVKWQLEELTTEAEQLANYVRGSSY